AAQPDRARVGRGRPVPPPLRGVVAPGPAAESELHLVLAGEQAMEAVVAVPICPRADRVHTIQGDHAVDPDADAPDRLAGPRAHDAGDLAAELQPPVNPSGVLARPHPYPR